MFSITHPQVLTKPSAPTNSLQFNNGGSFGGSSQLTFSPATVLASNSTLQMTNTVSASTFFNMAATAGAFGQNSCQITFNTPNSGVASIVQGSANAQLQISSTNGSSLVLTGTPIQFQPFGASAYIDINTLGIMSFYVDLGGRPAGLRMKSAGKFGTGVLAAGTVTVGNANVTANSVIFLTSQNSGAAPGALRISNLNPGVGFTVTSTNGADTSTFGYLIIESF